jgi:hypothetical protein
LAWLVVVIFLQSYVRWILQMKLFKDTFIHLHGLTFYDLRNVIVLYNATLSDDQLLKALSSPVKTAKLL